MGEKTRTPDTRTPGRTPGGGAGADIVGGASIVVGADIVAGADVVAGADTRAGAHSAAGRPRLLDKVREAIRSRGYSLRTEETYVAWIRRFVRFHAPRHPRELGKAGVTAFLNDLAVRGRVAATTRNQALSALLFLYRNVLDIDLPWLDQLVPARRPEALPVVISKQEVRRLLNHLDGTPRLVAEMLYGCGLRLLECLQLRLKDVDLDRLELRVRRGKGAKDRVTMIPGRLRPALVAQIEKVRQQHRLDTEAGAGWVELPAAFDRKSPHAAATSSGSTSSPRRAATGTKRRTRSAATTSTSPPSSAPSAMPSSAPACPGA